MSDDRPKVLMDLGGKTVIERAYANFKALPELKASVIVCSPELELPESLAETDVLRRCAGGALRQDSVFNGLNYIAEHFNPAPTELVLIHDAARPLTPSSLIERTVASARENGAAVPALAPRDSCRREGASSVLGEEVKRDGLLTVQTPQVFRFGVIMEAHRRARARKKNYTDDASMLIDEHEVAWVPGDYQNLKLTYPEDLKLLEKLAS